MRAKSSGVKNLNNLWQWDEKNYEEAELACLKKLIEIAKNGK